MANHCGFCDTRRPQPTDEYPHGTKMMIINDDWLEFCQHCGDDPEYVLTHAISGDTYTLNEVFEGLHSDDDEEYTEDD